MVSNENASKSSAPAAMTCHQQRIVLAAPGTKAFDLQEVALHSRFEVAFDEFRHLLHQTEIDLIDFAALAANKVVVVFRLKAAADVITQVAVITRGGEKDSTTGQILQNAIDGGQAHAFELLLQHPLHFERIQNCPVFQKQLEDCSDLRRNAMARLFQSRDVIVGGHEELCL